MKRDICEWAHDIQVNGNLGAGHRDQFGGVCLGFRGRLENLLGADSLNPKLSPHLIMTAAGAVGAAPAPDSAALPWNRAEVPGNRGPSSFPTTTINMRP